MLNLSLHGLPSTGASSTLDDATVLSEQSQYYQNKAVAAFAAGREDEGNYFTGLSYEFDRASSEAEA